MCDSNLAPGTEFLPFAPWNLDDEERDHVCPVCRQQRTYSPEYRRRVCECDSDLLDEAP